MPDDCEEGLKSCFQVVSAVAKTPGFDFFTGLVVHIHRQVDGF